MNEFCKTCPDKRGEYCSLPNRYETIRDSIRNVMQPLLVRAAVMVDTFNDNQPVDPRVIEFLTTRRAPVIQTNATEVSVCIDEHQGQLVGLNSNN